MAAVQEACEANKGDTEPERDAFITKMKEIVVAHRLCKSTQAIMDVLLIFPVADAYKAQLNRG